MDDVYFSFYNSCNLSLLISLMHFFLYILRQTKLPLMKLYFNKSEEFSPSLKTLMETKDKNRFNF